MDFIINIIMAFTSPVAAVSPDASAVVHMATVSAIMQLIALRTCGCCVYAPPSITIIFINQFIFTQNEMHTGPLKLQSQNKSVRRSWTPHSCSRPNTAMYDICSEIVPGPLKNNNEQQPGGTINNNNYHPYPREASDATSLTRTVEPRYNLIKFHQKQRFSFASQSHENTQTQRPLWRRQGWWWSTKDVQRPDTRAIP